MISATRISSLGLLGVAGLHVAWAAGSSWPMADAAALAVAAGGRPGAEPHTPAECLAVAGLLGTAAGFVGGRPRRIPWVRRAGAAGVVAVLATRGGLGLAGRTDALSPGATSERFRSLDRRVYSPLCLALAVTALPAVRA